MPACTCVGCELCCNCTILWRYCVTLRGLHSQGQDGLQTKTSDTAARAVAWPSATFACGLSIRDRSQSAALFFVLYNYGCPGWKASAHSGVASPCRSSSSLRIASDTAPLILTGSTTSFRSSTAVKLSSAVKGSKYLIPEYANKIWDSRTS